MSNLTFKYVLKVKFIVVNKWVKLFRNHQFVVHKTLDSIVSVIRFIIKQGRSKGRAAGAAAQSAKY